MSALMDNYRAAVANRLSVESKRNPSAMDRLEAVEWEADAARDVLAVLNGGAVTGPCGVCGSTAILCRCVSARSGGRL